MQKRYKKLFTDTGLFAISNFGSKFLTFLLVPLYTSVLSTEEYGSVDILTTTVNLLYPVLTLSIFDATLRFALDKKYDKQAVFSISIFLVALSTGLVLAATPFFIGTDTIYGKHWWFFVSLFFVNALQVCLSNYIKGCGKTKEFAIQGLISTAIFLLLNIVLLLCAKWGIRGYFISTIASAGIGCLYMIFSTGCNKAFLSLKIDKDVSREMLKYSIPMIPTSIAWWINASADKYMILGIVGVSANGLYGIAHKIPTIFSSFTGLFSQAWRISAISSYDDEDKQIYYTKVYKVYSLVCLYVCIILAFSSQLIAKVLFKLDYYEAWVLIPPLIIAALFEAYAGFLASIYAAANKTKFLSVSTCIGAAVNILFNYFLIKCLGTIGAPIATMMSFVVVWVMRIKVMNSFMKIEINYFRTIVSLFITIICTLYYAFQGPYKYLFGLISLGLIIFINYQDTKEMLLFTKATVTNILHKRGK